MIHRFRIVALTLAIGLWLMGSGLAMAQEAATSGEVIAAPTTLRYSLHLPEGWQFRSKQGDSILTDYLVFGDSAALVERSLLSLGGENPEGVPIGVGGWVAMLNQSFWRVNAPTPSEQISAFLQAGMVSSEVVGQQAITLAGQYPGAAVLAIDRAADTEGYIGAVQVGEQDVLVFVIGVGPSRDFAANDTLLQAIIQSIRVPAEANAQTSTVVVPAFTPASEAPPTAAPLGTPASTTSDTELIYYAMDGGVASITLPENWIVYDYLAAENVFAYGDSDAAAASRLATARPDLLSSTPLTGLGGLVILYDPAEAGVDPTNPDLASVLDSVTRSLAEQGYTITKAGVDFAVGGHPGRYAVVQGAETGFVALVSFEDKLAFVTATGMTDTFDANVTLLETVLESVRVPAETPASGIGGLSGLPEATPEVTSTPMPGIGGLGG